MDRLPSTPKRRSGVTYHDLLQSFGSRSTATSVTRARRESTNVQHKPEAQATHAVSKRAVPELPPLMDQAPSPEPATEPVSAPLSPAISSPQKTPPELSPARSEPRETAEMEESHDELAPTPKHPAKTSRHSLRTQEREELKMEARKKENPNPPRRSTRRRTENNILQSDTQADELALTPAKPKAPPRQKPDTARQRLRDDIAAQTKAKSNNFLVAHKEFFLPLLPKNNHIAKLTATAPIVEYEELSEQPKGVTAVMKPYQLSGLSFLVHLYNNGFSGILGDEMGLGKTLQTLSLFQYLEELDEKTGAKSEEPRPYLVVCPLSVLNSWVNEAQKWVPGLKVLRFHGTLNERTRLKRVAMGLEDRHGNETNQSKNRKASRKAGANVSKMPNKDQGPSYKIFVTTYETFQAEQNWFKHSFVWRYIVLDEGHKIKNNVTNIANALKSVSAEYRLILTGTPLQNNLVEMWALMAWLYPEVFPENTKNLFKESFDLSRGKVNQQTMDDARRLLELVMLRRMKDSEGVNLNLPPKEEVLLYVPLTPMQRFWYTRLLTGVGDSLLDDLFADVKSKEKEALQIDKEEDEVLAKMEKLEKDPDANEWQETADIMKQSIENEAADKTTKSSWQKLMNLVMQLRKCCSHPYLLPGATPEPYYSGDHVIRASGKFILLEKLLKNSIFNQGKKVLIFSGFTRTLDCCEELLALISDHSRDFKYLRLDGNTARARRNLDIRMFNDLKSDYKVILLSTRAGGLGINLTSAEDVIFLDEDWNPQITLQAEARAHRIGQTKKVTIYKLCTQGTVEEQMMGRIRKKLYLSAKITESMKTVHGDSTKKKASSSISEDMPQMDTSQLRTLVRRGAQTLSHPEINVTEMLSWDLDTMLQKCRDRPSDPLANPEASAADVDEEKWLSAMERVECAVFDGKRFQKLREKETSASNILPDSITREDRRKGKNVTVMVDGYAINKESMNCADWEAVPTFAGKDPRLAEPKREKRREIVHEEHCLTCFEPGDTISCRGCPRSYHVECLKPDFQVKAQTLSGFYCPQHGCADCGKKTGDAGGLIYRCRWCENGFCEDCLKWGKEELIGETLPEFDMLGEDPAAGAFYIKCPNCKEAVEEDEEHKEWMEGIESSYKEQHEQWLKTRDEMQRKLEEEREEEERKREEEELKQKRIRRAQRKAEKEQAAERERRKNEAAAMQNGHQHSRFNEASAMHNGHQHSRFVGPLDLYSQDSNYASPPALTDTSLPTPAQSRSGVSTPGFPPATHFAIATKRKAAPALDEDFYETRDEKRARLDKQPWDPENDPYMQSLGNGPKAPNGAPARDLAYSPRKKQKYAPYERRP